MSPADSKSSIMDGKEVDILVVEIQAFVKEIFADGDLFVHSRVDEFYYMEKGEELRVLSQRIDELQSRILLLENQRSEHFATVKQKLHIDRSWFEAYRRANGARE